MIPLFFANYISQMTGYKGVDALVPLGKGQSMLVYGEEVGRGEVGVVVVGEHPLSVCCVRTAFPGVMLW